MLFLPVHSISKDFGCGVEIDRHIRQVIWQFGPERRTLAIAERADFFLHTQSEDVLKQLNAIEKVECSLLSYLLSHLILVVYFCG